MHRLCLVMTMLCVWSGLPRMSQAQERTVTLAALLEAGQDYHPSLAKRALLKQSLSDQKDQLNVAYLPQLSLGGTATWQSDVTQVKVPVPGVNIQPPPKDQYKFTLDLQQNLWDFGATSDRKHLAEKHSLLEQEKVDAEWHQVRDRIMELYFAGVVQQQLREQARALDRYLTTTLEKAELALQQGVAIERDVLLARARKLEALQALSDADAQLEGIRRSLEELTGRSFAADEILAAPEVVCDQSDANHVDAQGLSSPELDVLAAQQQLLTAQEEAQEASDRPRVGAFATAGYGRPGLNMLSRDFEFYFIGGLHITIPLTYLYAGTHRQAQSQLAAERSMVEKQQDALLMQVNVELAKLQAEVKRLDAKLALDAQLVELREGARKQVEAQLAHGTATMTELISDLSQEDQARTQLAIHRHQRSLACHQIAMTLGKL